MAGLGALARKLFGTPNDRRLKTFVPKVEAINALEKEVSAPQFITAERLAPFTPRGTEVGVVLDLMIHDIGIVLELVKSPVASMILVRLGAADMFRRKAALVGAADNILA